MPTNVARRCLQELDSNPFVTLSTLANTLGSACDWTTSRYTVSRLVKRLGYSKKKAFRVVDRTHAPGDMVAFAQRYLEAEEGELICIDEAGFHAGECCRTGYSPRGKRLNVRRDRTLRCNKYTLVIAVSNRRGAVGCAVLDHNCRKADFLAFLASLPVSAHAGPDGLRTTLLMDNIAFHHSKETKSLMDSIGCRALYIPPYSPRFNAIEMVFSHAKQAYRRLCPARPCSRFDYRSLVSMVANGVGDLGPYFAHVERAVRSVLARDGVGVSGYDG